MRWLVLGVGMFFAIITLPGQTQEQDTYYAADLPLPEVLSLANSAKATSEIKWLPVEGCNCAPAVPAQANFVNFSYGLQPYWHTEQQQLDFGSLHRIGLYAFTLDPQFNLRSPPNWKNQRPFNEFINTAQAHNTYLDIVIRIDNKKLWSESHCIRDALLEQIISLVTEPLNDFMLNNLQPVVTLGISKKRTMADGVTLEMDLSSLSVEEYANAVQFVKKLRGDLNGRNEVTNTDAYFVNLILPANVLEDITTSEGEISSDFEDKRKHFNSLIQQINLILVGFKPAPQSMLLLQSKPQEKSDVAYKALIIEQVSQQIKGFRAEMQTFKSTIDSMDKMSEAAVLLEKILPVFNISQFGNADVVDTERFENELNYANWNFSGAALWSLPLARPDYYQALNQAFNPQIDTGNAFYRLYLKASGELCGLVCPNRWEARLLLFSIAVLLVVYGLVSLVIFELRALYRNRFFIIFMLLQPLLVLLILWCDPFWHPYQDLVLFGALLLTLLLLWFFHRQQQRREHYP